MKAGMKAGYTSPSAAASVSNLDQGQLSPDALALSCHCPVERNYTSADMRRSGVDDHLLTYQ
jgi:hypothetical protein